MGLKTGGGGQKRVAGLENAWWGSKAGGGARKWVVEDKNGW